MMSVDPESSPFYKLSHSDIPLLNTLISLQKMRSWKLLLLWAALMFAALGVKVSFPIAATHLPLVWTFLLLCFKPPYLFLLLNTIIISIVASSRFHHSKPQSDPTPPPPLQPKSLLQEQEVEKEIIHQEITLKRTDSTEIPSSTEKPLVSARFTHRKFLKSTSEGGRALKVVGKAKRHETLESTWKAITEGRSVPLSRHMKKCDTWQSRGNLAPSLENKSGEIFTDVSTAGRLRKEPSLSQEELNRRVEAFIRKFNEEMRLQRQESLEQYMQMVSRGAA
ncbi:uncharacterized protein LOC124831615 isoform X2 [Vigna umbellata]|uniref:uncharacterized protein LOC124831615 isoform X1 n=1 Tax=Vigna umbellata TaxID=87088 RepID=UPI001F5EE2BD|nr:uncharacterized protein LOC124831615 isoform X1 [Vigna umbellata]XP_047161621.1 uncharacterized protein LOC124831615 isoform X2 [Vigna umbellata]